MANHVRGSKRLKIIQNYLNGKEDDDYEVFPTRTEGKYIVRPRKVSLTKEQPEPPQEQPHQEETQEEQEVEQLPPIPKVQHKPKPSPIYDPTLSIEILNQLKMLGEEIKMKREKKEQKRMIKEVVQKQMMKPRYNYTQPQYVQEPNEVEQEEVPAELPQIQPPMRRRNNIFSDIY